MLQPLFEILGNLCVNVLIKFIEWPNFRQEFVSKTLKNFGYIKSSYSVSISAPQEDQVSLCDNLT